MTILNLVHHCRCRHRRCRRRCRRCCCCCRFRRRRCRRRCCHLLQRLSTLELLKFRVRNKISSKVSIFSSRIRLETFFFRSVFGISVLVLVSAGLEKKSFVIRLVSNLIIAYYVLALVSNEHSGLNVVLVRL